MYKSETVEILEELSKAGLVEKRVLENGVTQWRITELGRAIKTNHDLLQALDSANRERTK